ncbi:MAG: AAA family ATPase [Atopobiaceae bacterium]|nr:AAA family ATPase [Atopobiaceae bacterium]
MVILIAGASHVGKTLLAQRMLERYGVPYLSIDHLKMGLIRSGNTDLTPDDDDALTEYLWPIVREMVKTAIENGQNLVVEGCYVPPHWRRDFEEEYLRSIELVCLAMSDAYINAHICEIREYACAVETRLDDSGCTLGALREDNRRCIDAFAECNEKVTIIESGFESTIEAVLDAVHPRWSSLQSA